MKRLVTTICEGTTSWGRPHDTTSTRVTDPDLKRPRLRRWGAALLAAYWLACLAMLAMSLGRMEFHRLWAG